DARLPSEEEVPTVVAAGLLILRLVLGLTMAAHGMQKLLGVYRGPGPAALGAALERLRVLPGRRWAAVSGAVELLGGLLVAVGLLGVIAAVSVPSLRAAAPTATRPGERV